MRPLTILLVDDDRSLATTLSHGLRKAMGGAASVAVCFDSVEALSMLDAQTFDVVVSDYNMPGLSGLEFLSRVRQDHQDMILVLSTAYGTDALEEGIRQLGMGYITKPFEPSILVRLIEGLVLDREMTVDTEKGQRLVEEPGKPAGSSSSLVFEARLHE